MRTNILLACLGLGLSMTSIGQAADAPVVESVAQKNFVYNSHDKRDPFWKLIGRRGTVVSYDKDIQASDMVLEGIMAEPTGDSAAIINGNVVVIGDKVGFYIIKEIQTNFVILEKGQEIVTLKLKKEE